MHHVFGNAQFSCFAKEAIVHSLAKLVAHDLLKNKKKSIMIKLVLSLVVLFGLVLTVYVLLLQKSPDPGIAWKVSYEGIPELETIYQAFVESCVVPKMPENYEKELKACRTAQRMRSDLQNLPETQTYEEYELRSTSTESELHKFYDASQFPMPNSDSAYKVRLGCFRKDVGKDLEKVATEQIQQLMDRWGLSNRLDRLSDSRGSTYMPPGGFMEYHSNQNHYGGWRLYMHYLPQRENSELSSWFVYRHPFDGSYRKIEDQNGAGNLFRIRKPPKKLLWHGIYADTHRFSWGLWIPPELAQRLKTRGVRV